MPHSAIPKQYWNTLLVFKIGNGELETDSDGNQIPTATTVEVKALLKQSKDKAKERSQAGVDISEIYVSGYLCDPLKLPVPPPCEAGAEIDGLKGRLRIPLLVRSPYGAEVRDRIMGQRIEGYFLIQGGV